MVTAYAKMNESDVSLRWGKASLDIYLNVYNGGVRCALYGAEMAMMERYDEEATSEATIICRNDDQDALAGAVAEKSSDETKLETLNISWFAMSSSNDRNDRSTSTSRDSPSRA